MAGKVVNSKLVRPALSMRQILGFAREDDYNVPPSESRSRGPRILPAALSQPIYG
jgi:hypothetical protein